MSPMIADMYNSHKNANPLIKKKIVLKSKKKFLYANMTKTRSRLMYASF